MDTLLLLFSPLIGYAVLRYRMTKNLVASPEDKKATIQEAFNLSIKYRIRSYRIYPLYLIGIFEAIWWPYLYLSGDSLFWGENRSQYDLILGAGILAILLAGVSWHLRAKNLETWKMKLKPYLLLADVIPALFFLAAWILNA